MARTFRGESHHKVDAKGRVSIPALFRRVLEAGDPDWTDGLRPQLVIHYGGASQKYLECYTIEAMIGLYCLERINVQAGMERRMLERHIHGHSYPTEVDGDGRLVLPQKLREKIDLDAEAFFIASGDTFQVWKPETYNTEELSKTESWLDTMPDDFDPLSLLDQKKGE